MPVVIDGTTGITTPGLTNSGTDTLSSGTANGVAYLNGSKVLTTGSALVFDGTNLSVGTTSLSGGKFSTLVDLTLANGLVVRDSATTYANNDNFVLLQNSSGATAGALTHPATTSLGIWAVGDIQFFLTNAASEQMRLTSTGLGIGTSSPSQALTVNGAVGYNAPVTVTGATYSVLTTDNWIIANRAGTVTLTLPTASSFTGRILTVKNVQAQTVVSNASNVVPIGSTTAGTAILTSTAGKFATLVSDGTNWIIMQAN